MNKEGVHRPAESGRKMNLKNRERGGQNKKKRSGEGRQKYCRNESHLFALQQRSVT